MVVKGLILGLLLAGSSAAAQTEEPASYPAYTVERSQVRTMASAQGAEYRIYIYRPAGPPPESGYPVLYLLDGDDNFATAAETAERFERFARSTGVSPGLVVGIGYPADAGTRRALDYTPPTSTDVDSHGNAIGGAEAFRRFLVSTVRPAIEEDFAVDDNRQTLMGHSYGGLFVLDTLSRRPELFSSYVASSPSIWFGDRVVLDQLPGFEERLAPVGPRRLVLTVGELEQSARSSAPDPVSQARRARIASRRMVDDNQDLAERLESFENLSLRHRILNGENHGTAALPAIAAAVQEAFREAPQ